MNFTNVLINEVKKRQAEVAQAMTEGRPHEWAAYQKLVGEFEGLQFVLRAIDALLNEE